MYFQSTTTQHKYSFNKLFTDKILLRQLYVSSNREDKSNSFLECLKSEVKVKNL